MSYIIVDGNGQELADGVREHTVQRVAQELADQLGAPVWYSDSGEDSDETRVNPRVQP